MSKPVPISAVRLAQLRGVAQLATQATKGVSRMAEGVHQSVWGSMGVPGGKQAGQARGLTGLIYQAVRGITGLAGGSVDWALSALEPLAQRLGQDPHSTQTSHAELAVLSALNGVMGDQLAANGNPLALGMTLHHSGLLLQDGALPSPKSVNGKLLLLVHGLCMNDLQWASTDEAGQRSDLGDALAGTAEYTPIRLRYNTGLHISDNGAQLLAQLRWLHRHWPVPISELSVVAHSMGGLVSRSALHQAQQSDEPWLPLVKKWVFLGTPHHGAPLEQAGSWVDVLLGTSAYSRPFKRLAQLRSAGITDLRHGNTLASDWDGKDRFARGSDMRTHLPLPGSVACFAVAATLANARGLVADRLLGDGLVPLNSALGKHAQAERCLSFQPGHTWVAHRTGHMALLHDPAVHARVLGWMAA